MTAGPRPPSAILRPALLALALVVAGTVAAATPGLLVTIGEVTSTTAVVWARGGREGEVTVTVSPAGAGAPRTVALGVRRGDDLTGRVTLDGLTPATRYAYGVRQGGESVTGEFRTAPAAGDPVPVTFLWSGDLGGAGYCRLLDGGYRIFRAMARHPADFFLFVGDTVYADVPCDRPGVVPGAAFRATTLAQFRARHRYNREDPPFQEFLRRTPVYAIWDDHEVRNDFAGPSEPLMAVGRQAFLDYWPVAAAGDDPQRLYRRFRWGRLLEVFILDTRQYRSPNAQPDGPGKTMLGAAQRTWLIEGVLASTATWKVVVSSVPLSVSTGRAARDSWSSATIFGIPEENPTGFATERDAILRRFRGGAVKNLVFIVADVHHAELIRHHPYPDFSFHEFIAGPLSAGLGRPRPLDETLGPRSLFRGGGVYNFGEVTIEPALLTVRLIDEHDAVIFTHTIGPQ